MSSEFLNNLLTGPANVSLTILFFRLLLTTAIGVLVGMEREYASKVKHELFAGMRTFPLVSIFGFIAIFIAQALSPWVFVVSLIGLIVFVVVGYYVLTAKGDYGATTDISVIIVFLLGALIYIGEIHLAVASTVIVLLLLSLKFRFKTLLGKIQYQDINSLIKFIIISAIILPLLPDQTYGPYDVFNPRVIWYVIVLIAAINFAGYILIRILGHRRGTILTGLVGGLFSSTAVALSFSQKSQQQKTNSRNFAIGIVLASSLMFPRVLIVVSVF